jgi:hypothetical protein
MDNFAVSRRNAAANRSGAFQNKSGSSSARDFRSNGKANHTSADNDGFSFNDVHYGCL